MTPASARASGRQDGNAALPHFRGPVARVVAPLGLQVGPRPRAWTLLLVGGLAVAAPLLHGGLLLFALPRFALGLLPLLRRATGLLVALHPLLLQRLRVPVGGAAGQFHLVGASLPSQLLVMTRARFALLLLLASCLRLPARLIVAPCQRFAPRHFLPLGLLFALGLLRAPRLFHAGGRLLAASLFGPLRLIPSCLRRTRDRLLALLHGGATCAFRPRRSRLLPRRGSVRPRGRGCGRFGASRRLGAWALLGG